MGKSQPLQPRALGRTATPDALLRCFAVTAPGLEALTERELRALPSLSPAAVPSQIQVVPGGVEFCGDLSTLASANLHVRCASRLLLRLGELHARDFPTLTRQLTQLPWDAFVPARARIHLGVRVHSERCRLYHSGAITDCIAAALSGRGLSVHVAQTDQDEDVATIASLSSPPVAPTDSQTRAAAIAPILEVDSAPAITLGLWLRGQHDRYVISLDTSGALLHQRGYRREEGIAPLRETLAAAILQLAGYSAGPLWDPMCGAGTLSIEAALLALRRAPGLLRSFACLSWPCFPTAVWSRLHAQAKEREVPCASAPDPIHLWGSDHDPQMVAIARRNAERAGVADVIHFSVAEVGSLRLPSALPLSDLRHAADGPPGLVICNPPYGRRIGDPNLGGLYRKLARLVRSAPGWRLALLTPSPQLARLALRHGSAIRLQSGGLPVALYLDRRHAPLSERAIEASGDRPHDA